MRSEEKENKGKGQRERVGKGSFGEGRCRERAGGEKEVEERRLI